MDRPITFLLGSAEDARDRQERSDDVFLLIVTDQQRADWVGYERPGVVDPPNLDALAAGGARFARAYCTAPVWVPSRISLATGNLARRSGAINNWSRLPLTASTYYQRLCARGYRVGFTGNFDLFRGGFGRQPIDDPLALRAPLEK